MTTVTLPKNQYEALKKKASLYETILLALSEKRWGIENYSSRRIQEFMREDRLSKTARSRLEKVLNA